MGNGNLIKFHAKMNRQHILNPPSSTFCEISVVAAAFCAWCWENHGDWYHCCRFSDLSHDDCCDELIMLLDIAIFKKKGENNYHVERNNYDKTSGNLNDQDLDLSSWEDSSNSPRHFFHLEPRSGRSIIWITTITTISMINIFIIVIIHTWSSMIVTS